MKVRVRGRDGGHAVYHINARDLDRHQREHPELEILEEPIMPRYRPDTMTGRLIERNAQAKQRAERAKEPGKLLGQMTFNGFSMLEKRTKPENPPTSEP